MRRQVYYHIFANSLGCRIALNQIAKINAFIPDVDIHCGVVEVDKEASAALLRQLGDVANVRVIAVAPSGNEWVTLTVLHRDCVERWPASQPILYCHTKGAYSTASQPAVVPQWREWMEYFNFFRYREAEYALHRGYTVYGFDAWLIPRRRILRLLRLRPRFWFFSGNYWWATAGAVSRIDLDGVDIVWRHSAESDFLRRMPGIKPFDALRLVGLQSIVGGAYTNYMDGFHHFDTLARKTVLLMPMYAAFGGSGIDFHVREVVRSPA